MTQDELWLSKYNEVVSFIEKNKRNSSKYNAEGRGKYYTWIKHNRKIYASGDMKQERKEPFKRLIELSEQYRRKNQYV